MLKNTRKVLIQAVPKMILKRTNLRKNCQIQVKTMTTLCALMWHPWDPLDLKK